MIDYFYLCYDFCKDKLVFNKPAENVIKFAKTKKKQIVAENLKGMTGPHILEQSQVHEYSTQMSYN